MTLRKMSDERSRLVTLWIILAAVPAGIFVGLIYYGLSLLVPLALVDTFIAALVALFLLARLQMKASVANPVVAFMFAMLFSLFIYVTYRYVGYLLFRVDAIQYLQTTNQASAANAAQEFETRLLDSTGMGGFMGYLALRAKTGIGLAPIASYEGMAAPIGGTIRLTGVLAWLYWLFEFLVIAGLLTWIGVKSAQQPFAAAGVGNMGSQIGNVSVEQASRFAQLLKIEAFDEAWQLVTFGGEAPHPTIEVYIHQNRKKPTGNSLVLAARTSVDQNGRVSRKALFWTEVPNSRLPTLINRSEATSASQ
jgi:hypothetical protein